MKEKELRLALVCSGGISLAVYMHGITKEILKLTRASAALHGIRDTGARRNMTFADVTPLQKGEHDTEAVYFDALKALGETLDLRVIVDTIAGASAGGINGVILARALAHDLPMGGLRDLWLKEADALELLDNEARAGFYSKFYLKPLIWAYAKLGIGLPDIAEREIRHKLSVFVRSRWFKPPFGGYHLTKVLYDGMSSMGEPRSPRASLLPHGHTLELFVTVTDFYGYPHHIPIHDPPDITEKEYRHGLRFSYHCHRDGMVESDFTTDNVPALAFAGRATSCIPGAFPPAQIAEIDRLLAEREREWTGRARFMDVNFRHYAQADADPLKTSFIDGSVLNDKPFAQAIEAINERPAYRAVDRRVVYIDPFPDKPSPPPDGNVPGFFVTLKGAFADLPRSQPMFDELNEISDNNEKVRRLKHVLDALRPQIQALVEDITGSGLRSGILLRDLRRWREEANARAAKEAGFAYGGYLRLKIDSVLHFAADRIAALAGIEVRSPENRALVNILFGWATVEEILPEAGGTPLTRRTVSRARTVPPLVDFLFSFDGGFRRRRLRFVLRVLNQAYARLNEPHFAGITTDILDGYKRRLYDVLTILRHRQRDLVTTPLLREKIKAVFGDLAADRATAAPSADAINEIMAELGAMLDLRHIDEESDTLFTAEGMGAALAHSNVAGELITAYIGFAFWDVLTFSLTRSRDLDEYDEVKVVRVSPNDSDTIRPGGVNATLKGIFFNRFGAFFSRAYRENDYLWGRLHGADRLIDMLADAAGSEAHQKPLNIMALKKKLFQTILAAEREELAHIPELFASLDKEIDVL